MKKKLLIKSFLQVWFLLSLFWLTNWARIFFQPIESTFPANCPIQVDVMIDTQWEDTIWTEIIFWFDPNEIIAHWIVDWWVYDMPIWAKYFENMFYFSTTNLWKKYFNWYWKLWSLVIQSKTWTKEWMIKIINEIWKTNDSNIVSSDFKDILNQTTTWEYQFDNNIECKTKLSDFNIFKEPDISNLTSEQVIKKLEENIIQAKSKSETKISNKNIYYILLALIILTIILAIFIIKKSKNKKNENL